MVEALNDLLIFLIQPEKVYGIPILLVILQVIKGVYQGSKRRMPWILPILLCLLYSFLLLMKFSNHISVIVRVIQLPICTLMLYCADIGLNLTINRFRDYWNKRKMIKDGLTRSFNIENKLPSRRTIYSENYWDRFIAP